MYIQILNNHEIIAFNKNIWLNLAKILLFMQETAILLNS